MSKYGTSNSSYVTGNATQNPHKTHPRQLGLVGLCSCDCVCVCVACIVGTTSCR